jgi:hypothetical protein
MRRLVTTATGTIGRPDRRARVTMPSPQARAIFGTSAVMTTISPPSRARSMARSACAPPLWRGSRPRAPEPRIARTPRWRSASALISPSAERDTRLAAGSSARRAKWIMKCWPCHIAAMTGISGPIRS